MASNIYSKYANLAVAVLGKTAPPSNITFNTPVVRAATGGITLSWDEIVDTLDFKEYVIQLTSSGTWEDVYNSETTYQLNDIVNYGGTSWKYINNTDSADNTPADNAYWDPNSGGNTEIYRGLALSTLYTAASITTGTKTFLIKAVDTTGNYSTTAGSASLAVAAPAWVLTGEGAQTISHVINDGQLTVTWPVPSTTQFAVASYEVRYIVGNSSTNWAGATATGHGTTEGVHSATNSITFPVTWGPGEEGTGEAHRTFIIKAKDTVGNLSSNEIYKAIQISSPDTVNAAHQFTSNAEGTKVDARVYWTATTISASQLPIAHYKIFYQDYKTGSTAPTFANRGSAYLEGLGTTEFKQEVDWGPSKTNSNGTISSSTGTSNDIRRYWVVPVDLAGNWGVAYSGGESDHIGDIEDVTVTRPNSITGLATTDYSTNSSNGVVEINWNLPVITTAPITSIRVFWELPTWVSATSLLTSTRGEKNSKAGTATKYSTPVNWGPTNGSGETNRVIYFIAYDSIGNISVPTGITVSVNNPAQISSTALTSQVIDNNVILRWTDPAATSLPISSYDAYRCPAAGTCSVSDYLTTTTYVTNVGGTNTYSFFETAAGTYKYFVRTKDLAGNYSTPQAISTTVSEPRDFAVLTDVNSKYNTGALTAAYCSGASYNNESDCENNGGDWIEASKASWTNIEDESNTTAVLPVNTTETWQEHFDDNNWASPQAQISAGYHYFVTPETSATYYQQWDLGTTQASATVALLTTEEDFGPTTSDGVAVVATPEIFLSNTESDYELAATNTGGTWVSKGSGNTSGLGINFRYVKVKVTYASSNGALKKISQQRITLNLATVRDQSAGAATISTLSGTPTNGLRVNFNKTFQDITSIQVTPKYKTSGNQNTAIYDFLDVANPTYFDVYLLDATDGSFALGDFTWQATGV